MHKSVYSLFLLLFVAVQVQAAEIRYSQRELNENLIKYAKEGDLDEVKFFLGKGANVSFETLIKIAMNNNNKQLADFLVQKHGIKKIKGVFANSDINLQSKIINYVRESNNDKFAKQHTIKIPGKKQNHHTLVNNDGIIVKQHMGAWRGSKNKDDRVFETKLSNINNANILEYSMNGETLRSFAYDYKNKYGLGVLQHSLSLPCELELDKNLNIIYQKCGNKKGHWESEYKIQYYSDGSLWRVRKTIHAGKDLVKRTGSITVHYNKDKRLKELQIEDKEETRNLELVYDKSKNVKLIKATTPPSDDSFEFILESDKTIVKRNGKVVNSEKNRLPYPFNVMHILRRQIDGVLEEDIAFKYITHRITD